MDNIVKSVIAALVYIIAAPFVGALLAGVDRKITARCRADADRLFCNRFGMLKNF